MKDSKRQIHLIKLKEEEILRRRVRIANLELDMENLQNKIAYEEQKLKMNKEELVQLG